MGLMQGEYRSFDSRDPEPNPYWQQSRTRSRAQAEPQSAADGISARQGTAFLTQINQSLARPQTTDRIAQPVLIAGKLFENTPAAVGNPLTENVRQFQTYRTPLAPRTSAFGHARQPTCGFSTPMLERRRHPNEKVFISDNNKSSNSSGFANQPLWHRL
ncbi:MAG TPA: hypothetical protein VNN13_13425 [Methylomirabilota bacterium]|nr:hypothetical protein [Methylomirabilota bacterium]